ncbi:MAG: hypothetical protein ACJ764_05885 [Solirubrobacteraceae bacterium]
MARTATPLSADRIRIEDEVWEEAFSSRVRSRPPRKSQTAGAVRPVRAASAPRPTRATPTAQVRPLRADDVSAIERRESAVTLRAAPEVRRTIRIEGRGVERNLRYTPARHERIGFSPDRLAMWAVLLGFLLVLVATLSSQF